MEDSNETLSTLCARVRDHLRGDVKRLEKYQWFGPMQPRMYDILKRSIVVRQWEACEAIQALIESGHGAMCCTLLRPAYEELLWLLYLERNKEFAAKLTVCLGKKEISDAHKIQKKYLGSSTLQKLGFSNKKVQSLDRMRKPTYRDLDAIGEQLGWKLNEGQKIPSVSYIAKQVGKDKEYQYFYQATSRSVHFSVHELQRRVWGKPNSVKIGSNTFQHFWSDFGSYWSTKILLETMMASGALTELFDDNGNSSDGFLEDLYRLRSVHILTASELDWWESPQKRSPSKFGGTL
ncbi:hypothetical protein SAMN05444398_109128 [Roseovarius pacificus]|uniref:Uncharacterized protein n=1 Tax=Roseovarius pacificus TaxID=337701 RepID=A0A1M7FUA4_9RHOB|nr:DUF5677 domain-containing protein [Roseovarius pacificus]GGO59464.1 hypothetical protein GCM10011315_31520 [Roseovarius pacificus]SHM07613.1 hypothetical protein SAMN05444398_109128 [Roseovarius pacificus]